MNKNKNLTQLVKKGAMLSSISCRVQSCMSQSSFSLESENGNDLAPQIHTMSVAFKLVSIPLASNTTIMISSRKFKSRLIKLTTAEFNSHGCRSDQKGKEFDNMWKFISSVGLHVGEDDEIGYHKIT